MGDFDSAKAAPPKSRKVLSIPVKKDVTDTMYAVMMGRAKGFRSFVLLGCLGGARFDHSLANIEVLQYLLAHNCRGVMADSRTKVFLISDSRLRLTQMKGATVSVFPTTAQIAMSLIRGCFTHWTTPLSRQEEF